MIRRISRQQRRIYLMFTFSERHVTVYYYNDTRSLSTVTRWSFDNDQRNVTAFRLISEAAHSWSNDNTRWVCDVLSYYWTLSVLSLTTANDHQWPLVLTLSQFPVFVSVSVYATEREEHDTLQRHQRTTKLQSVYLSCGSWDVWQIDRRTHHNTWLPTRGGVITSDSVIRVMQLLLNYFAPHYFCHVSSQCLWLATTCYVNGQHQQVGFQLLLWPIFNL